MKTYSFNAVIQQASKGGVYVVFPCDVRKEFGKERVKVTALFDRVRYEGSVVNMGVKNEDGSIAYIIGIRKDIRKSIGRDIGDTVHVEVQERV